MSHRKKHLLLLMTLCWPGTHLMNATENKQQQANQLLLEAITTLKGSARQNKEHHNQITALNEKYYTDITAKNEEINTLTQQLNTADQKTANLRAQRNLCAIGLIVLIVELLIWKLYEKWNVRSVASTPNDKTTPTENSKTIDIWTSSKQTSVQILKNNSWVKSVAFSPDGKSIASGSADGYVRIWDIQTGRNYTLGQHEEDKSTKDKGVYSVAFFPDGKKLASAGVDRSVKIWDIATRTCLHTLEGHNNWVKSVAISRDDEKIAASTAPKSSDKFGGWPGEIIVWSYNKEKDEYTSNRIDNYHGIRSVAFSPNGKTLASASYDKAIKIWDTQTGKCSILEGHTQRVKSVAFSPDGKTLASGSDDESVRIWDIGTGHIILNGHTDQVKSVAFSSDGTTIVSAGCDGTIRIWDPNERTCVETLKGHKGTVWSVAFSPDGQTIASAGWDGTIRIWTA